MRRRRPRSTLFPCATLFRSRAANVGDVDDSGQAGVAADRQMPEMAAGHDPGGVTDAGRRVDDGRPGGHQLPDPQVVEVLKARDRTADVIHAQKPLSLRGTYV